MYASAQYKIISWCVSFNFKPSWFTWTLLMTYSKAKLKSNADKASPCFKPHLIVNMSDTCLPTWTLLICSLISRMLKGCLCILRHYCYFYCYFTTTTNTYYFYYYYYHSLLQLLTTSTTITSTTTTTYCYYLLLLLTTSTTTSTTYYYLLLLLLTTSTSTTTTTYYY